MSKKESLGTLNPRDLTQRCLTHLCDNRPILFHPGGYCRTCYQAYKQGRRDALGEALE